MRPAVFHPEGDAEATEAARYYESQCSGPGLAFLVALDGAVEQIVASPRAFALVGSEIRRKPVRRFPYSQFYTIGGTMVRIVAVAHDKRRPDYWHGRLMD